MPLVEPLAPEVSPELRELASFFNTTLGFPPNSVLTMQRRPEIAGAFIALNRAVMVNAGRVTDEQKRLIGLVASTAAGCRYCQAHTARAAERFGATAERLAGLWEWPTSPLFTEAEKAAFDLALAAASVPNAVTEALAVRVRSHWTEEEIVEIVGVIALFGFLNRWNDTMGTTLEAPAAESGAQHLGGRGWTVGKHAAGTED